MYSTEPRRWPWERLSQDDYSFDNEFVRWFAAHHARGQGSSRTTNPKDGASADFIMGELASRGFSIGIDDDKVPVLGVSEADIEMMQAVNWTEAAFIRRMQGKDWVALSCKDARVANSKYPNPVRIRLWLPATTGLLDGWLNSEKRPSSLRVLEVSITRGKPLSKGKPPIMVLPLSLRGKWSI